MREEASSRFTKHGLSGHPLRKRLEGVVARCYNKNNSAYKHYGGRGITVCDEWRYDFKAFHDWFIQNGWHEGDTREVDRIDNNGNYCPENCRLVSRQANTENTRRNIKYNGETAKSASLRLGGGKNLVTSRLKSGWSVELAFTTQSASKSK
jgi:hypothetical protein